jgi:hypothetical protein
MRFQLVYDGPLPSAQRSATAPKVAIRRQMHPQLQALWHQHPQLINMTRERSGGVRTVDKIGRSYQKAGFDFVPLVRGGANCMACRLEILILMREEPHRQIFSGGGRADLDNRIKTLIDGLRMPRQPTEMGDATPAADERPFYCLLEDDNLIHEFSVRSGQLLTPPRPDAGARDVVAIINVYVTNDVGSEMPTDRGGYGRH